ncbi:hypothetical protein Anas_09334 [Armadillidium nasatum]|uniref:Uncharacterized protein n=1 Tax=Armadillidium nasatum TaxID=96803 RepID=A0A5N5ST81_9CRUS|nr:hypothetical protein Anas_09334 [Armadillidium nasatum]
MNILTSSLLGIVSLFTVLKCVEGNSDCILISGSSHPVTSKDFRVTSVHEKYIMCGAYFCTDFPTVLPLELQIHEINSTKDNLAVYLEKKSITSVNSCGHCESSDLQENAPDDKRHMQVLPSL